MFTIINAALLILLAIVVIIAFKRPAYGYCCFIAIRILIPEVARSPLTDAISFNTTIIFVVFLALLYEKRKDFIRTVREDQFSKTLILLLLYALLVLPISDYGDLTVQYKYTIQFFLTDILPIIFFISAINNEKEINALVKTFLIATIICSVYSIFTAIIKFNPLVALFILTFDKTGDLAMSDMVADLSTGRGFAASGTFIHANGFGYFISMASPICLYLIARGYHRKLSKAALILLLVNLFLCKKRSPLVSMAVLGAMCFYLSRSKDKIKYIIYTLVGAILFVVLVETLPALSSVRNMLESSLFFWDDHTLEKNDVGGSSWELRVRQVFYPFEEIANNIILGHGYGWCRWFLDEFELHPMLYGFETIFSTAVCEFGILGYFIYYKLFYNSYKYSHPIKINNGTNYQLIAVITEMVLIIATGLNYFYFWGFSCVIMNKGDLIYYNHTDIK